ncbi:DMT family transporter [Bacillus benzoevorans]|uniref:Drug/metabolite transporter (DMT)-like permease n=1 Tax=Bacillus benzoevorans TaxID=1456 RepID=A0A7X0HSN5_9BACI|nr:DMT family transporter [Bacillus benzoevorans]MBB6446071.1 drug/metabolite transporter (DMT)-like permease [Bacillus benzoevorans]
MHATNHSEAGKGVAAGVSSSIAWGVNTVIIGVILAKAPFVDSAAAMILAPFVSSFIHDLFSSLWMILWMSVKGKMIEVLKYMRTRNGWIIVLAALFGGPIGMTCYLLGIHYIGATFTASISSLFPAIGALLAFIFLKERIGPRAWLGIVLSIAGVIILSYIPSSGVSNSYFILGVLLALGSAIGWGLEGVICAWGLKDDDADPEMAVTIRQTASALTYTIFVMPMIHGYSLSFQVVKSDVVWLFLIAAFLGAANYVLYYRAIHLIGTARGTALNNTYAAWALAISLVIFKTPVSLHFIIGTIIVIVGSFFVIGNLKELVHISGDFDINTEDAEHPGNLISSNKKKWTKKT